MKRSYASAATTKVTTAIYAGVREAGSMTASLAR